MLFEWLYFTGCPEGKFGTYCEKDCICPLCDYVTGACNNIDQSEYWLHLQWWAYTSTYWVNARHKNRNHFVEGWQSSIEYAIFYRKYYELQRKQIMTLFSIIIDCQMGMYGVNCVEKCGNCKNNETCDIVNGTCPNGCAAGYNGTVCKDGKLLWATIKIYSTQMMWLLGQSEQLLP